MLTGDNLNIFLLFDTQGFIRTICWAESYIMIRITRTQCFINVSQVTHSPI